MKPSVLVTGGTSSIGQAIAEEFLDRGWSVHLHFNQSKETARAFERNNETVNLVQANLDQSQDCLALAETVADDPNLKVLINNAALFEPSSENSADPEEWNRVMNVNARAPWQLSVALSPRLKTNEGSIVNMTDAAVDRPYSDYLPYFASKGALETLTKGLARSLAPEVRVNAVAPGPIDFPEDYTSSQKQSVLERTLLKRRGSYEEIARCVYFLAVEANYSTGTIIETDGGRHLN